MLTPPKKLKINLYYSNGFLKFKLFPEVDFVSEILGCQMACNSNYFFKKKLTKNSRVIHINFVFISAKQHGLKQ